MSQGSEAEAKALQPVIMRPGDAEAIRPFGIDMKVMLGAEHTGGTFSAIVAEVKPGEGPPPHLHRDREEYFFVLEGTYSLGVNGKESSIGPGTLVFVPRGTVHTYKNTSGSMGKLLDVFLNVCTVPRGTNTSVPGPIDDSLPFTPSE